MLKSKNIKSAIIDGIFIILGTLIYAIAIDVLVVPNKETPMGLTGLATQISHLSSIPTGILTMIFNIPLIILAWKHLGKKFVITTTIASICSSILLEAVKMWFPVYEGDALLVAILGGALMGLGLSMLYIRGTSMGGTDIVSMLINQKHSFVPIGKILLGCNVLVIVSSIFVYQNLDSALYSAVSAFVSSKVVDTFLLGADSGNVLYVVSDKSFELASEIYKQVGRGATVLPATGTAHGEEKHILMCAVRRHEYAKIKKTIKAIDPYAFVIVSNTQEVLGNGFKLS